MPDATPARLLRIELQEARASGTPFAEAWNVALASATVGDADWQLALG